MVDEEQDSRMDFSLTHALQRMTTTRILRVEYQLVASEPDDYMKKLNSRDRGQKALPPACRLVLDLSVESECCLDWLTLHHRELVVALLG